MVSEYLTQLPLPENLGHARIRVVGVGGGGVNAVRRMAGIEVPGVELIGINTDMASLEAAADIDVLAIGTELTRGLGAGGNPEVGRRAAEESRSEIKRRLSGSDLVFIAAGMGGGTGTGAAPVIAEMAKEAGAVTIAIVTTPFAFEGGRRKSVAEEGLKPLYKTADTLIRVSNDRLLSRADRKTSIRESFGQADGVMVDAIVAVSRIVNEAADINVDFADIKAVVSGGGTGVMAIGHGEGSQKVLKAAQAAIAAPLVDASAHGARGIVYCVSAGPDLTMAELSEAGRFISEIADPDAEIFFGMHIDPARERSDDVEIVLIATQLPDRTGDPNADATVASRVRLATERYFSDGDEVGPELPPFLRELDLDLDPSGFVEEWEREDFENTLDRDELE